MFLLNLPVIRDFRVLSLESKLIALYFIAVIPFLILSYEYIDLLLQISSNRNITESFSVQHVDQTIRSAIIMLIVVVLFLTVFVWQMMKSSQLDIAKLKETIQDFSNNKFSKRLDSANMGDLAEIAGPINVLGLRQQRTSQKVSAAMEEVISAASEMSDVIQTGAEGTNAQMMSVTSVAAAVQEMALDMDNAVEKSMQTNDKSQESANLALNGEREVMEMSSEMNSIQHIVKETNVSVQSLQCRSQEVGNIVDVIRGVAEQTNLLALNAAIEAARAGDQGRGFAVVADEVRQLASKTGTATVDISELISKMLKEVESIVSNIENVNKSVQKGVMTSTQAADSLRHISSQSNDTCAMISAINVSLKEQKQISFEISENISQINNKAKENSKIIDETKSTAVYLNDLANTLSNEINV